MGVIGLWRDGEHAAVADMLTTAGHAVVAGAAGTALAGELDGLVADAAALAVYDRALALEPGRNGGGRLPVLAVLPAGADWAAVAAALDRADEVIRQPLCPAELAVRVGRLLEARESARAMRDLKDCQSRREAALANATADPAAPDRAFHDDETELVRLVAERLDRTLARLGAEAALVREREFSALLMDTLPGGLVRLDRNGVMRFCNPRAAAILELEARHLAAPAYDDAGFEAAGLDGDPLAPGEHPFARVLATGRPVYDRVLSIARPGGGRKFLSVSAAPLMAPDGSVDEVVVSVVDVTGQKALERQLAHALKMESLGQLAPGIAHEINTPVQYVTGNLEFLGNTFARLLELLDRLAGLALERQGDSRLAEELTTLLGDEELRFLLEETPAALRESREGLDRVAAIVLSMKRFAHPGLETPRAVDVALAVADTLAVSRSVWRFAADVAVDIDADLPPVLFVPGDFNQVLLNIVVNAAQAVAERYGASGGKGHIAIRAARSGPAVELVIADDGPGIPEAIRQRIFDPFFTTKAVGKGTGQGLAIVHAILDRHKVSLDVLSSPGGGTSFVLTLPVAVQPQLDG
ncbi:two-component system sensor histidine kinase NtrB [Solidesulfovibrio sp.]